MAVLPFHTFCPKVLKLHLTPGQNVIAKVAFGDMSPEDLRGEERDLAIQLFGGVEHVTPDAKRYVCMRLGRGSGKTTMCAAYAVYKAVTHDVSRIGPGDTPYVIVIAPDKETAKLSIRMCREMLRTTPALERLIVNETDQMIGIMRPDGRMVRIEAFAATRGGAAVRGRTIMAFIMDEAEFFTSNLEGSKDYSVNDHDIFNAMTPRLMWNAKGLLISTPWPVDTLMGKMFEENWGKCINAVAIKAPTILVRGNDPHIAKLVQVETDRDPDNARRELFCEIDHVSGGEFFDAYALSQAVDSSYTYPGVYNPKWPVAIGCDLGFTSDSSTLAVVQYDGQRYICVYLEEWRPEKGKPVKPSTVFKRAAEVAKRYNCPGIVADGYYREAIKESLEASGIVLYDAPTGSAGKAEVYQRVRTVLHEERCKIPDVALGRRLIAQAKLVVSKAAPGGTISIRTPRRAGMGHGDLVSGWTLAVWKLTYSAVKPDISVFEPGSPEWTAEFNRRVMTAEQKLNDTYKKSLAKKARMELDPAKYRKYFGGQW